MISTPCQCLRLALIFMGMVACGSDILSSTDHPMPPHSVHTSNKAMRKTSKSSPLESPYSCGNTMACTSRGHQAHSVHTRCSLLLRLRGGWDQGHWDRNAGRQPNFPGAPPPFRHGGPPSQQSPSQYQQNQQRHAPFPHHGHPSSFPPPQGEGMHPSRLFPHGGDFRSDQRQDRGMRFPPPHQGYPPSQHAPRYNSVMVRGLHEDIQEQQVGFLLLFNKHRKRCLSD